MTSCCWRDWAEERKDSIKFFFWIPIHMRTKIGLKCDRNKTEIKAKEAETCCRLLQFKRWNRKKKLWTKSAAKFGFQVSAWGSNCIGAYFWPLLTSGLILILLCHSRKLIWYQYSWKQLTWSHNSPNVQLKQLLYRTTQLDATDWELIRN